MQPESQALHLRSVSLLIHIDGLDVVINNNIIRLGHQHCCPSWAIASECAIEQVDQCGENS